MHWLTHPLIWINACALLLCAGFALHLTGAHMFTRLRNWIGRWQEPVVWLPAALLIALLAYYLIPAIDPTAGIDGWGGVWAMLPVSIGIMLAGFLAWLLRRTYHVELTDHDERELIDVAAGIQRGPAGKVLGAALTSWPALGFLLMDRLLWLAVFWLCLTKLVP